MPKVALTTLGCKVNQFETETMEGLFKQKGYEIVPFEETADFYVINTCSVTSLGDRKSRQIIRRAQRQNEQAIIAVCGCYSQVHPEEIKAIEGVRVVLGTKERSQIVELVEQAAREDGIIDEVGNIMEARDFEDIPLYDMPQRTRAFLKIEDGCQNFCSYCIIPYARGPVKSRHLDKIHAEAKKLVAAGFKEIVLTGIHLGAYGRDLAGEVTLADACREVLKVEGLKRLRLGSLESIELSPDLFELIRSDERFCAHLHLPLQAGSDSVLKDMNRHYDTAEFARLIEHVEREVPGVAVSTDIIVGFPGETEEQFQQGLAFVAAMNFSRMHVFPYSRRSGTPAAERKDQIPDPVKKERAHRMQELAARKTQEFHQQFLGKTLRVLFETDTDGITDGLTDNYIRVYTDDAVVCGDLYEVELERLYRDGVWGKVTEKVK
ncbi:tRNA (N(6)-L-threonylcarbamoyladenosine(37)-C(2))-methylthiotransferase MtaB [Selenomonas caprae]|uniref:Threonylcarbamoyladenosine tRNA methylthiotransferase MtaB n=1 Tax=Selenomonas caprae TaxID=2606905 RepID=A0A5D6WFA1_9FIRM|nr:tRNA (N(6)-L-threonylcarbamoyladenosine(37)-C(2))-methylthiotransferase MtaB [Selenomonas caprae]MBQ1889094.1 tRNA (N(6)-L-threonylcarbamoyladenosine(37)-C(2))-methylthiotransferase MtaB [Selenomonas sp.]TYZ27221.1 tRNA (N(6)-L-threonylcarbamoyladenosine(37)-C(2))-methylthiotransferase MtaB [Selenomonas caprae]